jgi:hypothetical protein
MVASLLEVVGFVGSVYKMLDGVPVADLGVTLFFGLWMEPVMVTYRTFLKESLR